MHFAFGECGSNTTAAAKRYTERLPARWQPHHGTIASVTQKLRETRLILLKDQEVGKSRNCSMLHLEEETGGCKSSANILGIAKEVGVSYCTIRRIIKEYLLYHYRLQRVQSLGPQDCIPTLISVSDC